MGRVPGGLRGFEKGRRACLHEITDLDHHAADEEYHEGEACRHCAGGRALAESGGLFGLLRLESTAQQSYLIERRQV